MRFAIVENGYVVNIAEADSAVPKNWVQSESANIGDEYDGARFRNPRELKNRIATRRYKAEIGGLTVSGVRVETDDRSKLLINGAALEATMSPAYTMQWKTPAGFVELSGAEVIGIARAVRGHVQECFDREAELLAASDAGTFTEEMLEQGWPGQQGSPQQA